MISGFPGLIYTKFSQYGKYLIVDCLYDFFPMAQGTLLWQPILRSKLAKSNYSPLFVALTFRNRMQYRQSGSETFNCDDLALLYVNLVNVGPVTPEFKRVVSVHPLI